MDRREPVAAQGRLVERARDSPCSARSQRAGKCSDFGAHECDPARLWPASRRRPPNAASGVGALERDRPPFLGPSPGASGSANRFDGAVEDDGVGDSTRPARARSDASRNAVAHAETIALGRAWRDRPTNRSTTRRTGIEDRFASGLAQLLGIPQPTRHVRFVGGFDDDGRPDGDRTGPRSATDLVHAGHQVVPPGQRAALLAEVWRHRRASTRARRVSIRWGREFWGGVDA